MPSHGDEEAVGQFAEHRLQERPRRLDSGLSTLPTKCCTLTAPDTSSGSRSSGSAASAAKQWQEVDLRHHLDSQVRSPVDPGGDRLARVPAAGGIGAGAEQRRHGAPIARHAATSVSAGWPGTCSRHPSSSIEVHVQAVEAVPRCPPRSSHSTSGAGTNCRATSTCRPRHPRQGSWRPSITSRSPRRCDRSRATPATPCVIRAHEELLALVRDLVVLGREGRWRRRPRPRRLPTTTPPRREDGRAARTCRRGPRRGRHTVSSTSDSAGRASAPMRGRDAPRSHEAHSTSEPSACTT